jgi:hypothetical protein
MAVAFNQSYSNALAITPDDAINFDGTTSAIGEAVTPCDAIYVGAGGVVPCVLQDGVVVNFTAVTGELLPIRAIRVNSTNLGADKLVAFYAV